MRHTLGLSRAASSKSMKATGDEVTRVTDAAGVWGAGTMLNEETQSASTAKMKAAIERMMERLALLCLTAPQGRDLLANV